MKFRIPNIVTRHCLEQEILLVDENVKSISYFNAGAYVLSERPEEFFKTSRLGGRVDWKACPPSFLLIRSRSAEPHSSVESVVDLGTDWRYLVQSTARPIFFPRIDDSHCDRIHSSLTTVRCFNNGYVGKQPVAWKEYCGEYWLKELQESRDKCTGCHDITEILLKIALNTIQSNNRSRSLSWCEIPVYFLVKVV